MVLKTDQIVPILYDLAMTMAGETRPHALATAMLQRLLLHTGCSCGLLLLNPAPGVTGKSITAETYVAIGSPAIRVLEGKIQDWPAEMLFGEGMELIQGWLPPDASSRYALKLDLPGVGYILLFSTKPHVKSNQQKSLLAPVLAKFASSLRHCLKSEANVLALAESKENLLGMLESTPDWVWRVDKNGVYTFSNIRIHDLLGYWPEEIIGKTPFDFMPADEANRVGKIFADIAARQAPFHALENTNLHKDGHLVVLESSGTPLFDSEGNFKGYHGTDRDITARKQIQQQLEHARDEAEAANRAKTIFLSSMSHEFRTPLNAILGHAQLIGMQENLPQDTASSADEILQAGKALLTVVNNILDYSSIASGEMEMRIETFPINKVIDACVAHNGEAAAWKRVPIDCVCTCKHCTINADHFSLLMVLNQFVSNAIKFNREGGRVTIRCRTMENRRIRISVQDEGPGISAEKQALLFSPFQRLGSEKGQVQGSGVGLTIARQLAEAMSGSIGVESTPGEGSTFWVEIPSVASDEVQLSEPACEPISMPDQNPQALRVLVAEDYAPNQAVLKMQLSSLGCEAEIAANGQEALSRWQQNPYDIILTDINMPVMDGRELARTIREQEAGSGKHIPIICITAAAVSNELEQATQAGMDDALTKPISLDDLRIMLERWGKNGIPAASVSPISTDAADDAVLDLEHLYRILGDTNEDQARQLIATFIESADKGLDQLSPGNDPTSVAREMHKLKSSARTIGALSFAKLAEALEQQIMKGKTENIPAALGYLREELSKVSTVASGLQKIMSDAPGNAPVLAGHDSVLIVDDDPVVLQQMSAMLTSLGIREVLTASNGRDALKLLSDRNAQLDTLVCDLNMPEMDGVELIRLFGRTGFKGGLILMSGADEKVLSTVGKLADLQGLRVLGQLLKPVTPGQIVSLLTQKSTPRTRKRQGNPLIEVSAKAIREGMDRDEFSICLQPKVDANSLKPVGVEALARWQHPGRGFIPPEVFISVAEREGLIRELSQMLVSKALMEGARLHAAGFPLTIALNLSGLWLDDLMLPDFILATTHAAKLRPSDVILEVTETGVMKDLTTALDVLTRLRLKGFGLSIDDFGIGYSSFEQLDRIPFNELKLDRIFVSKGAYDATARAILQGSMDMARKMALSTVAEGVESEADLEMVRKMGCDRVQGYLIAKPMPVGELTEWLKRTTARV